MRDRAAPKFSESLRRSLLHLSFVPLQSTHRELLCGSGQRSSLWPLKPGVSRASFSACHGT